jgi:hypothetical protein
VDINAKRFATKGLAQFVRISSFSGVFVEKTAAELHV